MKHDDRTTDESAYIAERDTVRVPLPDGRDITVVFGKPGTFIIHPPEGTKLSLEPFADGSVLVSGEPWTPD